MFTDLSVGDLTGGVSQTDKSVKISEYLDPTERYNYYDSAHDALINTSNTCALSLYLYLSVVFRYYLICPLKLDGARFGQIQRTLPHF